MSETPQLTGAGRQRGSVRFGLLSDAEVYLSPVCLLDLLRCRLRDFRAGVIREYCRFLLSTLLSVYNNHV